MVTAGNVLVGGFNFGTGSSREQAATALKHAGFVAVIVGSVSETYKRNALNNGLLVIEIPTLVNALKERFGTKDLTIVPNINATLDFVKCTATLADEVWLTCCAGCSNLQRCDLAPLPRAYAASHSCAAPPSDVPHFAATGFRMATRNGMASPPLEPLRRILYWLEVRSVPNPMLAVSAWHVRQLKRTPELWAFLTPRSVPGDMLLGRPRRLGQAGERG